MKHYFLAAVLMLLTLSLWAQRTIRDRHITNQQERMVFKQWSQSKFTPTSGFLGLNPNYLLTWAWHPNYPNNDLRPLGPAGPQTQRLAFAAAMQHTENAYKLHADTLKNTAISEAVNYAAVFSRTDPLWQLYYRHELEPLLNQQDDQLLNGTTLKEKDYLVRTGVYNWFKEESAGIKERLEGAMNATLDRGSRILAYHRLLLEYRKLNASWQAKKLYARRFLLLSETAAKIKSRQEPIAVQNGNRTDRQIADDILSKSKL
ncbi:hypothetical protein [Pedobacter sp. Hv1]|uniref:hypothetical protein n=1 Tax=Pedobacter sp. Hv1 TaxID=1740090 RepID=UPI0006D8C1E1|nr:hypothetical protein [Pedobacter sp. Hv1]KQB99863.1 hypothetical protein AQF98_15220 [Pedobacter sp. Hv1]